MGTSSYNLDKIRWLFDQGHFRMPAAIADIGCQQLSHSINESVRTFAGYFHRQADERVLKTFDHYSYMGDLYRAAGFDYVSVDIVDAPHGFRFDLNLDAIPASMKNKYDIVINSGTSEHVLNQLNALKAIHDLARPGGIIYSMFLINGFGDHGLLRYSSRFVKLLAEANQYEILDNEMHTSPDKFDQAQWVIMKRTSAADFKPVLDI
jgi:SAM-dependent methyltransferase